MVCHQMFVEVNSRAGPVRITGSLTCVLENLLWPPGRMKPVTHKKGKRMRQKDSEATEHSQGPTLYLHGPERETSSSFTPFTPTCLALVWDPAASWRQSDRQEAAQVVQVDEGCGHMGWREVGLRESRITGQDLGMARKWDGLEHEPSEVFLGSPLWEKHRETPTQPKGCVCL